MENARSCQQWPTGPLHPPPAPHTQTKNDPVGKCQLDLDRSTKHIKRSPKTNNEKNMPTRQVKFRSPAYPTFACLSSRVFMSAFWVKKLLCTLRIVAMSSFALASSTSSAPASAFAISSVPRSAVSR